MSRRERFFLRWMSLYPPFLGAGIRVRRIAHDPLAFEAELRQHWWNRNAVGTHFGGSLYTMADPFYMLILIDALGREFTVWDKSATIRFRRPGRGTVRARFEIPRERIEEIRREALAAGRSEPVFVARVLDAAGETVTEIEKTISIRPRSPAPRG
ncbi:MAG TPA: DUF4442 domain-containing protein [Thermoanaerobaculia bacterium]|nr:DUF4442 domain-containing protein [Thermoanaerobaculia bacterium]